MDLSRGLGDVYKRQEYVCWVVVVGKEVSAITSACYFYNKYLKPAMGGHPLHSPIIAFC
jgi:hypothetical protein